MKRYIISIAALAAGAVMMLTASCSSDDAPEVPQAGVTRIVASTGDPIGSRTAIDPTNFINGDVGLVWEAGDKIGVFSDATRNAAFTNEKTASDKTTTFAGSISGTPRAAYYPYNAANNGAAWNALKGNVPSVQTWATTTQAIEGDYKFGVPSQTTSPVQMKFRHMVSLIKFTIESFDTDLVGEKLESITLQQLNSLKPMAGDFTFDLSGATATKLTIPMSYKDAASTEANAITVNTPDLEVLSQGNVLVGYLTCLPTIKSGDKLHVTMKTDVSTASFDVEVTETFIPNMIYNFKFMLSTLDDAAHNWRYETVGNEITIEHPVGGSIAVRDQTGTTISNHRKVVAGTKLTITATANTGKKLVSLKVNGTQIDNGSTYTVTGKTVISATFDSN